MPRYFLFIFVFALLSCDFQEKQGHYYMDPHSFSKPHKVRVTHLSWKATVDFTTKTIRASATWTIENKGSHDTLILDTKNLLIHKVLLESGKETDFTLGDADEIMGQALYINIPSNTQRVTILYEAGEHAEALQWLSPQQTANKRFPFLFTQSQAILARSWIPCQDTPGVRFTYDAEVTVPKELLALMSASNPKDKNETGIYSFEMKQPIPSYLLALTVGDITFKSISKRSGVYAETILIDTAAWEFADLEKMIQGAEALYGAYQWDQYDVIVLPPSFPFGGMENPRITFATPTILAGDRSLTSLIAHELAHSWSGNLVTNATWDDFWLNEGFTVYFETRIMEKLYGRDYAEMLASLNLQDLNDEIESLTKGGNAEDTKLKLNLKGRNPDDGVTDIAYNKGYFFLRSIEEKFGREKFDAFVKDYFSAYAFQSINTEDFVAYIKKYYAEKFAITLEDAFINSWIYSEGLPTDFPKPTSERFAKVDTVISQWRSTNQLSRVSTNEWSTHEWLHFLKNIPEQLTQEQMKSLDAFGKFSTSGNAEIITAWGVHAIRNQYVKAYPAIESFLVNTGRRKFLMPLYSELMKSSEGQTIARNIYSKARPNYHFVAVNSLDKLVK